MFIKKFLSCPRKVGSITPSGRQLSEEIAKQAIMLSGVNPLVELGPGSGAITNFLPKDTISIEVDDGFAELLKSKYPERCVINTDATNYLLNLKRPVTIVSSIPLIGNPNANNIKDAVKMSYSAGMIETLITYSYGRKSPYSKCNFKSEIRTKFILFNIPPANIWVYS